MRIFNLILEIITSPLSFLVRSNVSPTSAPKWGKPLVILGISIVIVVALVLLFYRSYIFR